MTFLASFRRCKSHVKPYRSRGRFVTATLSLKASKRRLTDTLSGVKHIVSVSLGSASRDFSERFSLLGEEVRLERRGVDGDVARAAALVRELDSGLHGPIDAIGLGGINLHINIGKRRYTLRDAARIAAQAARTPVLDGGGLKVTLERRVVEHLDEKMRLEGKKVLLVSAVDRFGMAEALAETGANMRYGDLVSLLDVPIQLRSLSTVRSLAHLLLPIIRHAPIGWLYPTGAAQEEARPSAHAYTRFYAWADVIAGDWHLIRRYLPERLAGKIILTNTTTVQNVELLRGRGATWLVTTTPRLGGRSMATNVLEAALVAVSGGQPLSPPDLADRVREGGLRGTFLELNP